MKIKIIIIALLLALLTLLAFFIFIKRPVRKYKSKARNPFEYGHVNKDHRLTLRIPKWLLEKVDEKRKERVGSISRNLWILELIEKATKK